MGSRGKGKLPDPRVRLGCNAAPLVSHFPLSPFSFVRVELLQTAEYLPNFQVSLPSTVLCRLSALSFGQRIFGFPKPASRFWSTSLTFSGIGSSSFLVNEIGRFRTGPRTVER